MKLRQRLAVALAAAMVITSVPVTTMAASSNTLNRPNLNLEVGEELTTTSHNLTLNIKLYDDVVGSTVFFLKATDFKFMVKDADGVEVLADYSDKNKVEHGYEIEVLSSTWIRVDMNAEAKDGDLLSIPIRGTVTGATPYIEVDAEDTVVSNNTVESNAGPIYLSNETISEYVLEASFGSPSHIPTDGRGHLGSITIEEQSAGHLSGKFVKVEINHSADLHFDYREGDTVAFSGTRGFAGLEGEGEDEDKLNDDYVIVREVDGEDMIIEFVGFEGYSRGSVVLPGLTVESEDRYEVPVGDVEVTVSSQERYDEDSDEANVVYMAAEEDILAYVYDFSAQLEVEEVVDLVAGGEAEEVVLTFKESVVDSLDDRSKIYFEVSNASFVNTGDIQVRDRNGRLITHEEALTTDGGALVLDLRYAGFTDDIINKYELTVEVAADAEYTGDVVVTATSRDLEESVAVVVGESVEDKTVTIEGTTLDVGYRDQVGGTITIKEHDDEVLHDDDVIFITLDRESAYDFVHIEDFDVEVTEGSGLEVTKYTTVYYSEDDGLSITKPSLPLHEYEIRENVVAVDIHRESDEAATLTIKNIKFDTSHATPEGTYDLVLSGSAIGDYGDTITKEDFLTVVEPSLYETRTVVVTANSKEYTVNGETKTALAAPYIVEGRTMIPLRFVSEEFGAEVDFGVINGVGTVTITKEGKVIQFQNQSNVMNQNGIMIPMDAKAEITNGTTYVPFRYLANALGVDPVWDAATQTITFSEEVLIK